MSFKPPQVLLVGHGPAGAGCLLERLHHWGCECRFASNIEEARALLGAHAFDLVLSEFHLEDGTAYPLIALAQVARTTLFFSQAVEDSCWWLPAVEQGRACLGRGAFRPNEFSRVLDELLREVTTASLQVASKTASSG